MLRRFSPVKREPGEPDFLFAGSFPDSPNDFQLLREHRISRIVNLTFDTDYPPGIDAFAMTNIPVDDFEAPRLDQIHEFIDAIRKARNAGERVYVHCQAGIGRTGTMLACWFLASDPALSGPAAVKLIRDMRPPSIDSASQERAVLAFAKLPRG